MGKFSQNKKNASDTIVHPIVRFHFTIWSAVQYERHFIFHSVYNIRGDKNYNHSSIYINLNLYKQKLIYLIIYYKF